MIITMGIKPSWYTINEWEMHLFYQAIHKFDIKEWA